MFVMAFLQWVHPEKHIFKLEISWFDPLMLKSWSKRVLFPWSDALVWFVLEAGVEIIVAKKRYSVILAHTAVL